MLVQSFMCIKDICFAAFHPVSMVVLVDVKPRCMLWCSGGSLPSIQCRRKHFNRFNYLRVLYCIVLYFLLGMFLFLILFFIDYTLACFLYLRDIGYNGSIHDYFSYDIDYVCISQALCIQCLFMRVMRSCSLE